MKRFPHFLKANKTGSLPKQIIFFDTETEATEETEEYIEQSMRLFVAVYWEKGRKGKKLVEQWTHGKEPEELAQFILSKSYRQSNLYVISANIWFDLRVSDILEIIMTHGYKVKSFFSKGKAFMLVLKGDKRTIRFLNFQNIYPVPVKKVGEILGLPKLEVDFKTVSDENLLPYCRRDVEIIYKAILLWFDFLRINEFGVFGITLPSQAFNAYRHRFMDHKIGIHAVDRILELERSSYFGGRCECFHVGTISRKNLVAVDINSMYPDVMQRNFFPAKLKGYSRKISPERAYHVSERNCIVVNCDIETDEPVYAKHINNKTCFPIGRFNATLCTESFRHAYDRGRILKCYNIGGYQRVKLFEKWVNELYNLRLKYKEMNDTVFTYIVKLLLNSLYGKFGQLSDEMLEHVNTKHIAYKNYREFDNVVKKWVTVMQIGDLKKVFIPNVKESLNSFPAIAAHVTDYARIYLWKLVKLAGRENVFYIDTDSLYCNMKGYYHLIDYMDDFKLGMLKLEKLSRMFHIYGNKDYQFGKEIKLKGVPRSATKISDGVYQYIQFPSLKGELKKGLTEKYRIMKITKHLKRIYDKGIVNASGRVEPFRLSEF